MAYGPKPGAGAVNITESIPGPVGLTGAFHLVSNRIPVDMS